MNKRKKIIFYTMAMIHRGTERTIANLANHFIKEYDITIVTNINGPVEYPLDKKIKVIPIDKTDKRNECFFQKIITKTSKRRTKKLKEIIKQEQPNLIIVTLPEPSIRLLSLKKEFQAIPIIVSIRNHPNKEFRSFIGRSIRNHYYKKADVITVLDEHYQKYFPNYFPIKVIPNYLSDDFIKTEKPIKKEKRIITVASLEKQKNIPLLIKAFSLLNHKYEDYHLLIIGDGKEKKHIQKLIQRKGLEDKVILKNKSDDLRKDYLSSTLFVLPSNYEGMPNALLEAMSCHLPVITTDSTEAIHSIIEDNANGIIVSKKNIRQLHSKMEYLLDYNEIRDSLSIKAFKGIKKYHKSIIIQEWDNIIKRLIH